MSPFNIVQAMTYEVFERPDRSLRNSDGLFTEARWAKMKRRGDVKKKSQDRMKNWVVWDSPAILHQAQT